MAPFTTVQDWFGNRFNELDPKLQQLYVHGGRLSGEAGIELGQGVAGWLGWLLAKCMSIPTARRKHEFAVDVTQEGKTLHWRRSFDGKTSLDSDFIACGRLGDGFLLENSGPIRLALSVDVVNGGWYWRRRRIWLFGVPMPQFLFPSTVAYKRIECGRYRFYVSFSLPLLGPLLSYGGLLDADIDHKQQMLSVDTIPA
jgi:hypothetical protein